MTEAERLAEVARLDEQIEQLNGLRAMHKREAQRLSEEAKARRPTVLEYLADGTMRTHGEIVRATGLSRDAVEMQLQAAQSVDRVTNVRQAHKVPARAGFWQVSAQQTDE